MSRLHNTSLDYEDEENPIREIVDVGFISNA